MSSWRSGRFFSFWLNIYKRKNFLTDETWNYSLTPVALNHKISSALTKTFLITAESFSWVALIFRWKLKKEVFYCVFLLHDASRRKEIPLTSSELLHLLHPPLRQYFTLYSVSFFTNLFCPIFIGFPWHLRAHSSSSPFHPKGALLHWKLLWPTLKSLVRLSDTGHCPNHPHTHTHGWTDGCIHLNIKHLFVHKK